jgi:hypothetical protein
MLTAPQILRSIVPANPATTDDSIFVIKHGRLPRRNSENRRIGINGHLFFRMHLDRARLGLLAISNFHLAPKIVGRAV